MQYGVMTDYEYNSEHKHGVILTPWTAIIRDTEGEHVGGEVIAMDEINCQECGREITEREAEDYGAFCSSCG